MGDRRPRSILPEFIGLQSSHRNYLGAISANPSIDLTHSNNWHRLVHFYGLSLRLAHKTANPASPPDFHTLHLPCTPLHPQPYPPLHLPHHPAPHPQTLLLLHPLASLPTPNTPLTDHLRRVLRHLRRPPAPGLDPVFAPLLRPPRLHSQPVRERRCHPQTQPWVLWHY
jgi:hypothetical protein